MTDTAIPEGRLWHGGLRTLAATLRDEAQLRPEHWAWRRLPRGAVVGCRVHPEHHVLQFRVARETKPTAKQRHQWYQELAVFERFLDLQGWARTDVDTETGGVAALYLGDCYVLSPVRDD